MLFGVQKYAWQLVLSATLSMATHIGLLQDTDSNMPAPSDKVAEQETAATSPAKADTNQPPQQDSSAAPPTSPDDKAPSTAELTAEPTVESSVDEHPLLSSAAPDWIRRGSYREGEVDYRLVSAGPAYLQRVSEAELNELMVEITNRYIDERLGSRASDYVSYELKTIRERCLVTDHYYHDLQKYDVGPMYQSYAQLQFDEPFRQELDQRWRSARKRQRLVHAGFISVGVFGVLLLGYGYLRLDHATRGFYTGRLQFVAGLAAIALLAVEAIALSSVPWL